MPLTAAAAFLGLINWQLFGVMTAVSVLFGAAVTLLSLLMSDIATRRYMGGRDLVLLVAVVLLESCGYRQMNAWWGCVATVKAANQPGRLGRGQASRIRGAIGCRMQSQLRLAPAPELSAPHRVTVFVASRYVGCAKVGGRAAAGIALKEIPMKRLLAFALVLAVLAPSLAAQAVADFTGTWEGTFTRQRPDGTETLSRSCST